MKLSVLVVCYNMQREIPRTLQGLARDYQVGASSLDYEVILLDNGSREPLQPECWAGIDVPVDYIYIEDAPSSPARAINLGLERARGELVCLMIDGAHILTPGVFRLALACDAMFECPVIATRYFWLGPEAQNNSIEKGYCEESEDRLLADIAWPEDGYRLFEIGSPLVAEAEGKVHWLFNLFESNCLFMPRQFFERLGGADEAFDIPGGGFLNVDIFKRAVEHPGASPVQLIGEGCFHQIHGGATTNISTQERDAQLDIYLAQYEQIRGHESIVTDRTFHYFGHIPCEAAKIHRWKRR